MLIISSLWPSTPRKLACDRSGSFKLASPPAASGAFWASAPAALTAIIITTAARVFAGPQTMDAKDANLVRIRFLQGRFKGSSRVWTPPPASTAGALWPSRPGAPCRVPNTLPRQDLVCVWPRRSRRGRLWNITGDSSAPPPAHILRANFYSILREGGQSELAARNTPRRAALPVLRPSPAAS